MIYSTGNAPVKPEGATPLTGAQAWKGLVLKAHDSPAVSSAQPLLPLRGRGGERDAHRTRGYDRR
jgi:hypothetical protein